VKTTAESPRELALTLARLRVCAVIGQALAIVVAARWLHVDLPQQPLFAGVAALALLALAAWWRLKRSRSVSEGEIVAHFAADIAQLCWQLYFTGGATNPFVSLYVIPVALAAGALSARGIAAVVLLASIAYGVLLFYFHPLPAMHAHDAAQEFSLHVIGMGVTFALTAPLLGFFMWRLARGLREREHAIRRERERALRDESILAIATQAAGAAHELNTPLSTIRTLLGELRRAPLDAALTPHIVILTEQTERCREILRELVAVGAAHLSDTPRVVSLHRFVDDCAERFRLLRPEIELALDVDDTAATLQLRVAPGLQHALVALLNNAADASAAGQSSHVEIAASCNGGALEFAVRDHGAGLSERDRASASVRFFSDKNDGLGLGLALATATAERLHGTMQAETPPDGGTRMRLRIPLEYIENRTHAR